MITVREALQLCLDSVPEPQSERIETSDALGRILAEDVRATTALPPWDNSAMDGFAVIAADTGQLDEHMVADPCSEPMPMSANGPRLRITETIAAGETSSITVTPGTAARIMTGAPIPDGADAVVMREHTSADETSVQVHQPVTTGQNIRPQGEDVSAGEMVLAAGRQLNPSALGLCAAVGRAKVLVSRQPRVAIVSTGNEVQPPGQPLKPGQIHSSNTHALCGWVEQAGGIAIDCGIATDDVATTRTIFQEAINADLVVSTGGVSVGDFDVVRQAMADLGADMQFWKIKIKPGKPMAFGIIGGTPAFGLPGNPVSCQVGFLQFVRPWIRTVLGDPFPFLPVIRATFEGSFSKKAGRAEFVRVRVDQQQNGPVAVLTGHQGSGNQLSMVQANALLLLSEEEAILTTGDTVHVQLFEPFPPSAVQPGFPW